MRNRSFEDSDKPEHWSSSTRATAKSEMAIDTSRPLNPMNRRSLRVSIDGTPSLVNEGYWGMSVVKGEGYQVRLAARAADGFKGPLTVALEDQARQRTGQGRDHRSDRPVEVVHRSI